MDARKEAPNAMEVSEEKTNRPQRSSSENTSDKTPLLSGRTKVGRSHSEGNPKSIGAYVSELVEKKEKLTRKNSRRKSFRFFKMENDQASFEKSNHNESPSFLKK